MSTKTYAVIQDSKVVNMILLDSEAEYLVEENQTLLLATDDAAIGGSVKNGTFVAPVRPEQVSPEVLEDPKVAAAKEEALSQLVGLGVTESVARTIVGLPPA